MSQRVSFYVLLILLIIVGSLSVYYGKAKKGNEVVQVSSKSDSDQSQAIREVSTIETPEIQIPQEDQKSQKDNLEQINFLINSQQFSYASSRINDSYSELSSADLDVIRTTINRKTVELDRSGSYRQLIQLSEMEVSVFDDKAAWSKLAYYAEQISDWQQALEAMIKVSTLESDGIKLEKQLSLLVKYAAKLRAVLENQGDKYGVHRIYDQLYKTHPGHGRFQLELAYSYLRLEQVDQARPLLKQLQYDLNFGEVSRQILAKLDSQAEQANELEPIETQQRQEILVPLGRLGTNLTAEVMINRRPVEVLLDTGASITALDNRLIQVLGLQPMNESINLVTANGRRSASLYRVKSLHLGQFQLQNHVVAGIDFEQHAGFAGLLGTDVLAKIRQSHTYVIDDQRSALVFKPL